MLSCHNGNISTTKWRTLDQDGYSAYGYQYDEYYRLKHAKYGEYDFTSESWQKGKYNTSIHYDNSPGDIGNVSVIKRNGYDPVSDSYKLVDDIIMNYTGHKLTSLAASTFHDPNLGYKTTSGSFTYDARGNITSATGKGISEIVYNHLDLPTSITHTSGRVSFVYDAEGGLISQVSNLNNLTVSKSYFGGLEFESREYADNIPNPGYVNSENISFYYDYGRIVRKKSGGMTFDNVEYVLRDHLGNTRVTFSDINNDGTIDRDPQNGEILKIAHYYPFGMEMQGKWDYTPSSEVPPYDYGFNGIQELSDLQLNFSTYRILDPGIGRWYQVDPKAEAQYGITSYVSMNNNPISMVDPEGDLPFVVGIAAAAIISGTISGVQADLNGQDASMAFAKGAFFGAIGGAVSMGIGYGATSLFGTAFSLEKAAFQLAAHGLSNGFTSVAQGGSFEQGLLSGSVSSVLGSTSTGLKLGGFGTIAASSLGGGIGSTIAGGDFIDGAVVGLTVGALNHAMHQTLQKVNLKKSKNPILDIAELIKYARELGIAIDDLYDIIENNDYVTHDGKGGDYYYKKFKIKGNSFKVYVDGNRNNRPIGFYEIGQNFKLGYSDPIHFQSTGKTLPQWEGYNYGFSIISTRNNYLIKISTNSTSGFGYLKELYYD